jgi:multiple antibiotic resistance protein
MLDFLLQACVTLFVIIDPFGIVPVFIASAGDFDKRSQKEIARKASYISGALLIAFAFLGFRFLGIIGISQSAFRVAGGVLLLLVALEMVMKEKPHTPSKGEKTQADKDQVAVFPIAIPMIAGPGSIASVVVLMHQAQNFGIYAEMGVLCILLTVLYATYEILLLSMPIMKLIGVTGTGVLTRVFGIILAALSVQYIMDGVSIFIKMHNA